MKQYGLDMYSKKKHRRPHLRSVRFHNVKASPLGSQGATIEMPQDISMFTIAKILLRYLAKHGAARTPLIFQQAATKESVKKLASSIISERDLDLSTYPIETIATTLKRILRALPIPIIHCQEQFFAILRDGSNLDEIIPHLRTLLKAELHPDSFTFLADLVKLLAEIAASHNETQMTANSLAYLFGPTLMRLKTESAVALLHDPKAINRAVEFLIEHFEEIFAFSSSKKTKSDPDSSQPKPNSKSRLLQKKIRMVLRRPFNQMNEAQSAMLRAAAHHRVSECPPPTAQALDHALYASIILTDDERERFREPPPWSPPDLPSKDDDPVVVVSSKPPSPKHLSVNITDNDPISESGRYKMQLDAARAEQIFVENARKREMQFLDEERRAQEMFTLRRTYSGVNNAAQSPKNGAASAASTAASAASAAVAEAARNLPLLEHRLAPNSISSVQLESKPTVAISENSSTDIPQPLYGDLETVKAHSRMIAAPYESTMAQPEGNESGQNIENRDGNWCCDSDASTSSTRTSISSTSSQDTEALEVPDSPRSPEMQSSWWKDVQRLRDAAALNASAASTPAPNGEDVSLDFDKPPAEPAPSSPFIDSDFEASSIESLSDVSNQEVSAQIPLRGSDTESQGQSSTSSSEREDPPTEPAQNPDKPFALERSAPVAVTRMKRVEPSSQLAKRMQMFEDSRRETAKEASSSHISLKSIRAPGGIIHRRAPVTKFKQIFEKQTADKIDVDDEVRIIESSPRIELFTATSVIRKDQWHAEAAREAPKTIAHQAPKTYVQRVRNRLLSEPSISASMPASPSSRRSSADTSWNEEHPSKESTRQPSIQRIAQPAIVRKLSVSRVQNLGKKLAERPQSLDLSSQRSSIADIPSHRVSLSETAFLKPLAKITSKPEEPAVEIVRTLPSGFYRIQNARRRDIRGGLSQFSASDDSDDDEVYNVNTMHRSRPSLSATAFLRRLSTASSFADDSATSSRAASVQVLDPISDESRHGSQVIVPSVMRVSISQVANETPLRTAII